MTLEILKTVDCFLSAWEKADIDQLTELMTNDCVYSASVGPGPGITFSGKEQIRQNLYPILVSEQDGAQRVGRKWVAGDFVFVEWSFDKLRDDGGFDEIKGIDVLQIVQSKIAYIDAYRKAIN